MKRSTRIPPSEITPEIAYRSRREFLAGLAGAGFTASLPAAAQEVLTVNLVERPLKFTRNAAYSTTEKANSYAEITGYNNFYEFGSGKEEPAINSGAFKTRPWSVAVEGSCAKPGVYTLEDILKPHPLEERVYRHRCVEGWSMVIPWVGFPLADLLKRFEPNGNARFVEFITVERPQEMIGQRARFPRQLLPWPYKEGLRIDEALHPLALVAVGLYGEELPNQNGAPLRLVLPWKYGFKSIKSIVKIRFVDKQPLPTWVQVAPTYYGFYSNVNPEVATAQGDQRAERRIGEFSMRRTLPFNGYAEQVAGLCFRPFPVFQGAVRSRLHGPHGRNRTGDSHGLSRRGLFGDGHRGRIDFQQVIIPPIMIEGKGAGGKGVCRNDVGACTDIILMHRTHDIRMGEIDLRAPGLAAHGRTAPLDIRARAAIKNDGLAAVQFLLNVLIHGRKISELGRIASAFCAGV